MFDDTPEGFLQPLIWNLILYAMSAGKLYFCNMVGMWGLFWLNDNGVMQAKCFQTGL